MTRLSGWLLFGVVLGVTPILADVVLSLFTRGDADIIGALSDGELLIAAATIGGGALGEVVMGRRPTRTVARVCAIVSAGATLVFCLLCAVCFAAAKLNSPEGGLGTASGRGLSVETATLWSVGLFAGTVLLAGLCVGIAAGQARTGASA